MSMFPGLQTVLSYRRPRGYTRTSLYFAAVTLCAAQTGYAEQSVTVSRSVPLHVTATRTAAMRVGAPVDGVLTAPVWVYDRLVFPKDAVVHGTVTALEPVEHGERVKALLNGDLTPLHTPVVTFNTIQLGDSSFPIDAEARVRQTQTVRFTGATKSSMRAKVSKLVSEKYDSVRDEVFAPGKKDRALRLVYNQLPYHPQRVWKGTEFIADMADPAKVQVSDEPEHARVEDAALVHSLPPNAEVKARLVTSLDSDTAKQGEVVTAVVTQPVFDGQQRLVLPEGTELEGTVLRAKAARSFGRNGTLRFTFRNVQRRNEAAQHLRGTVTGAEGGDAQNLAVDAEGNVKAQPAKNRFAAPLLLAALAAIGHDDDGGAGQQVVGANGFGFIARFVTLGVSSPNVSAGFGMYGLAKSVYYRFVAKGQAVTFPKDTLVEVELSDR